MNFIKGLLLAALIICSIFICSTYAQTGFSGKWAVEVKSIDGDWRADMTLYNDGTLSWTDTKPRLLSMIQGTWESDGSTISMTVKDRTFTSKSISLNFIKDGTYTISDVHGVIGNGKWYAVK